MLGSEKKIYLEFPLFTSNSNLIFEWIYKWSLNYKIKNSDKCLSFQIILKETKNIWSIANLLIKGRLYMKPVWFDESFLMMRSRMFDSNWIRKWKVIVILIVKIYLEFPLFTSNSNLTFEWTYKWSLNYKIKNSNKCLSLQIILKGTKNIWSVANLLIKGKIYILNDLFNKYPTYS